MALTRAGVVGSAAAQADERQAHHAAQFQLRHCHLRAHALLFEGIEGHREQIAARGQGAADQMAGNAQFFGCEFTAGVVAGDGDVEIGILVAFRAQQQETALATGDGQGRVHHRCQHLFGGQRILQGPRHFHQRTQLDQVIGAVLVGDGARRGAELFEQALDVLLFDGKRELVGIAYAEFDAIRIVQNVARDLLAIHPGAVAAVQILDRRSCRFRKRCGCDFARCGYRAAPSCCRTGGRS